MSRGRHHRRVSDRSGVVGRFAASVRATSGHGGVHSWRHSHGGADDRRVRRLLPLIVLFVGAFALASGAEVVAYNTTPGGGTGQAQAVTLSAPGVGSASNPTTTSLTLSWGASSGLPTHGGYVVVRSTSAGGPYSKVSSGTCSQATTLASTATSCTDTGLSPGTTYYYQVEAGYDDGDTLWVSAPDSQFSGATGQVPANAGPTSPTPGNSGSTSQAPAITSSNSTSFFVGAASTFQMTASGLPAPTFANEPFSGCTPSTLPSGVTFSTNGLLSGTPDAAAVGSYTVCVDAENGVGPNSTQAFTLTIETGAVVFSSPAVSGATSSTPNLGPITVRRQTGSGSPIATGDALTVNLTSNAANGMSFGTTQFATASVTSVTIPSGQSTATFWYGSSTPGTNTITVSAPGYMSGAQSATTTTAPAGLGIVLGTGSTGSPAISCGPPAAKSSCNVTGVGTSGRAVLSVTFWGSSADAVVYSATQASTISESGQVSGSATIGAGASGSAPNALTASLGTSSLTFGPYTLTINVSS